jgi:hypothetical protein
VAEVQVQGWGTSEAPNDRRTKDSERLEVVALEATFDGSAAAAAFVPAVQIISDSGAEVGTFPLTETLQVGDSVTVTFAPFLGRSGVASSLTTAAWARYNGTQIVAVAPGSGSLDYNFVDGTALLDLSDPFIPTVLKAGVYIVSMVVDTVGVTAGAQMQATVQMSPYACGRAQAVIIVGGLGGANTVNPTGYMNMAAGAFINNIIRHDQAAAASFHHVTDIVLLT